MNNAVINSIIFQCKQIIEKSEKDGTRPVIMIGRPEDKKRMRKYLHPFRGGPKGRVVQWGENGIDFAEFDARELMEYLLRIRLASEIMDEIKKDFSQYEHQR